MTFKFRSEKDRGGAVSITRRIFAVFVAASALTLLYLNMTDNADMKLFLEHFPEIGSQTKRTILATYKMGASLFVFFADVILVGPFAYLSYFGKHIKPKDGKLINALSFFDIGLLLAVVFTVWVASARFILINMVTKTPVKFIHHEPLTVFCIVLFAIWFVLGLMKVYSYPKDKRRELARYAIKF